VHGIFLYADVVGQRNRRGWGNEAKTTVLHNTETFVSISYTCLRSKGKEN